MVEAARELFRLTSFLQAHDFDVKGIDVKDGTLMATASRDGEVKLWELEKESLGPTFLTTHHEHSHFVNAVAFQPPSEAHPEGQLASGGADNLVHVMDLASRKVNQVLLGHENNVCAVAAWGPDRLLTGSWDGTAVVWEQGQRLYTLTGHEKAVWTVLFLDSETYLTGSADQTIRLWQQDKCLRTFTGHSDCVRGLALVDLKLGHFASVSNDGSLRLWSLEAGEIACIPQAHDSYIYTIAILSDQIVLTAGEDRCIKVWDLGKRLCTQSIPIPAVSIWCLRAIDADSFACGTNDGQVYLFSRAPERPPLDAGLAAIFQERLDKSAIARMTISGVDASAVQSRDSLQTPGRRPGENRLINTNGRIEAFQWDGSAWLKMGEVVDAAGSAAKQTYQGQQYDYVFDVQLEDGGTTLKLPYNVTDNPYVVAQEWVGQHDLPAQYVEQVVDFILKNTQSRTIESGSTGPSMFNPYMDTQQKVEEAPKEKPAITTDFIRYASANLDGIQRKILDFNGTLKADLQVNPADLGIIVQHLKTPLRRDASTTEAASRLIEIFGRWPIGKFFPILDLLRMMVLDAGLAEACLPLVKQTALKHSLAVASDPKTTQANTLMQLRVLTNALQAKDVAPRLGPLKEIVGSLQAALSLPLGKEPETGYAALLNLCLACQEGSFPPGEATKFVLSLVLERLRLVPPLPDMELLVLSAAAALKPLLELAQRTSLVTELACFQGRQPAVKVATAVDQLIRSLS